MSRKRKAEKPLDPAALRQAELRAALADGDPAKVRALIEAGADVRYKAEHGYDTLIDAVHGRDISTDPRLLELLSLLISHGVELSGTSAYGESALRVLSRIGRFDAVRLLLDAGADRTHLQWTPLAEAVALGSSSDVEFALERAETTEERDFWERTPLLIALLAGDVPKAELLAEYGAETTACGRCGRPPLFHAIASRQIRMVRWLLDRGADVHQTDEFGGTALMEAVENGDLDSVEMLLASGANVHIDNNGTALKSATNREIILRLLEAGADPADMDQRAVLGLNSSNEEAFAGLSEREYRLSFARRFVRKNPERMQVPFWEAMIRCGASAYEARVHFDGERLDSEPVWCARRFGQSLTLPPDGRAIQVGGEHEDFYDPDFCIYNDVFVHERDGSITIYGYPEDVFPPTDFHTATLMGDHLWLIGSTGYMGTRRFGETPVYRLNVKTFRIEQMQPRGDAPGWIYRHRAEAVGPHAIRIWGGSIAFEEDGKETHRPNADRFVLDLATLQWRREP